LTDAHRLVTRTWMRPTNSRRTFPVT